MDDTPFIPACSVALLAGGVSLERAVSLASGDQAELALLQAGYECERFDPAATDLDAIDWASFDACFIALHGGSGEDGRVQAQLENWNVPYTGSGPAASKMAMNKSFAKCRFLECGVPTLPFISFAASDNPFDLDEPKFQRFACLQCPLVIKPQSQGSSLGIAVAMTPTELNNSVKFASEFDGVLIAEPYVSGREFTIALLDRVPLPIIEIIVAEEIFNYDAKYCSKSTWYQLDPKLPHEVRAKLEAAAIDAAAALGTAGLSRVDLLLDDCGDVWVLEVNTIPGLTDHSLAPRAAAAAGMNMAALVDWMVRDAVRRHRSEFAVLKVPT